MENLSYPIGKFSFKQETGENEIQQWIQDIEQHPKNLQAAVQGLSNEQLNTPYRDGGWTVCQVVHHLADSHMNAYIRFKLALTEHHPTIKPYEEKRWAEMEDAKVLPIDISISILTPLHIRWTNMLKKITNEELERTVFHPESKRDMSVKFLLALYSWHGKHHVAHVTALRDRNKW